MFENRVCTYLLLEFINIDNRCELWYRISGADKIRPADPKFINILKTIFDEDFSDMNKLEYLLKKIIEMNTNLAMSQ